LREGFSGCDVSKDRPWPRGDRFSRKYIDICRWNPAQRRGAEVLAIESPQIAEGGAAQV
jgi:hypothetical protein